MEDAIVRAALQLAKDLGADAILASKSIAEELHTEIPVITIPEKIFELSDLQNFAVEAYVEGKVRGNVVVGIVGCGETSSIVVLRPEETLFKDFVDRVDPSILKSVLHILFDLRLKGAGSLFIIGDSKEVLKRSHQLILNPFKGHPRKSRDIRDRKNWETIKKFAQLDGAVIVGKGGEVIAAGRYIDYVEKDAGLPGLGGRNASAASISRETKAIAVALSATGDIRIYKDGKLALEL